MPMTLAAAIQTTSNDDIDRNLEAAGGHIETAAAEGAKLVVLPECFALMPSSHDQLRQCAEAHGEGKIQQFPVALVAPPRNLDCRRHAAASQPRPAAGF